MGVTQSMSASVVLLALCLCTTASLAASAMRPAGAAAALDPTNVAKVPVDLFVMSKCPDAVYCESFLAPVLKELEPFITLQLHFIGQKQDDGSWRCQHGEEECSGDLQQLCVQKFSKPYNRVKWTLGFVLCSNKQGLDATGSFATASRCLQETPIPQSAATKMLGCIYGPTHQADLKADFSTTASLGIKTSCTIQAAGSTLAVRDRGEWVQAPGGGRLEDFKESLCSDYAALNRGRLPHPCRARPAGGMAGPALS